MAAATHTLDHLARRDARADRLFRYSVAAAGLFVLISLIGAALTMAWGGREAIGTFGWSFLGSDNWDPGNLVFGGLAPIVGTLITAAIALLIAVPISFGIALFLTEVAPPWLRGPVGTAIELLAGIPSIIYGMWGLFVLVPFLGGTMCHSLGIEPLTMHQWLGIPLPPGIVEAIATNANLLVENPEALACPVPGPYGLLSEYGSQLPLIGSWFAGPPIGIGMLTAGLVLSIMVIPFIASVMREVFLTVPTRLKESAYALGSTTFEVVWDIVLPYTRSAVIGGIFLGLGRALGETMAVTFVLGNANRLANLLEPSSSIAATIANEFGEAFADLHRSSLLALGFVLFIVTFIVLSIAKLMLMSLKRREGK